MSETTRCGIVAVIGAPNAGKSTLVNTLVDAKVAIVTPKVQTTRSPVRGIAVRDRVQLVFIDTPGIFVPKRRLERAMVDAAWSGTADADVSLLVIDATRGLDDEARHIVAGLGAASGAKFLVLNKVDAVKTRGSPNRGRGRCRCGPCSTPSMIPACPAAGRRRASNP